MGWRRCAARGDENSGPAAGRGVAVAARRLLRRRSEEVLEGPVGLVGRAGLHVRGHRGGLEVTLAAVRRVEVVERAALTAAGLVDRVRAARQRREADRSGIASAIGDRATALTALGGD